MHAKKQHRRRGGQAGHELQALLQGRKLQLHFSKHPEPEAKPGVGSEGHVAQFLVLCGLAADAPKHQEQQYWGGPLDEPKWRQLEGVSCQLEHKSDKHQPVVACHSLVPEDEVALPHEITQELKGPKFPPKPDSCFRVLIGQVLLPLGLRLGQGVSRRVLDQTPKESHQECRSPRAVLAREEKHGGEYDWEHQAGVGGLAVVVDKHRRLRVLMFCDLGLLQIAGSGMWRRRRDGGVAGLQHLRRCQEWGMQSLAVLPPLAIVIEGLEQRSNFLIPDHGCPVKHCQAVFIRNTQRDGHS
mmetsp:Transcript_43018/g.111514  ORF Transcript_43018/g.111514 Transcript_43018/m.111514 type:complete len:298 (-) Transcript_43018:1834-2727(-)